MFLLPWKTVSAWMAVLLFLAAGGCRPTAAKTGREHWFAIALDGRPLQMQLAVENEERQRGLMFREKLEASQGMLFVFEGPDQRGFYMRNVSIPLDVAYFSGDGVLREVLPMYPYDERSVPSARKDIVFVLEMNQGWFRENGVHPGAKLDLAAVAKALEARGFPKHSALGTKE